MVTPASLVARVPMSTVMFDPLMLDEPLVVVSEFATKVVLTSISSVYDTLVASDVPILSI